MEKYNFIENKWYSFNWDYSGKDCMVIAKIERFNHEMISISWRKYLWDNTISIRDAYECIDISNIKELSLCDIQQYLPEDHPEKIKAGSYLIRPDAATPKALKITKITRGEYYINPSIHFEPHPLLRFATEEEINKAENKLKNLEKEFVLPEKWCINKLANPEIIGKWFNKNSNVPAEHRSFVDYCTDLNYRSYLHYPKCFSGSCTSTEVQKGYTEITFEQFKKYVLKEEVKEEESKTKELPFKIGDCFRVTKRPNTWSSSADPKAKYPLDNSFPYESIVKKIIEVDEDHISILDENGFGWHYYPNLFVKVEEKPKEPRCTVIHLPTQEKWNFFISKWNPMKLSESMWNNYEKNSCINLSVGRYGTKDCYIMNSYNIISFAQWCEDNGYTFIETKTKAKDKKVEMKPDYSNYPKVSFEELQIGSKFVNIKYNTDIRTVTAKTVDTIFYSDSDGEKQEVYKEHWYKLDCRSIHHPTSEYKIIPEPEALEMVSIDKYFKIRN